MDIVGVSPFSIHYFVTRFGCYSKSLLLLFTVIVLGFPGSQVQRLFVKQSSAVHHVTADSSGRNKLSASGARLLPLEAGSEAFESFSHIFIRRSSSGGR